MEENMNYQPQPEQQYAEPVAAEQPAKKKSLVGAISMLAVGVIAICACAIIILGGYGIDFRNFVSNDGGEAYDPEVDAFINELGGVSETFEGVISNYSYSSPTEAAEAFVTEELSGYGYVSIDHIDPKGELSDSEITSLNFPDYVVNGCDAIEKLEVTYNQGGSSYYSREDTAASNSSDHKTIVVYVIKYGVDWKYFAPLPETGNTINKSYYDSVFNTERYQNCTLEQSQTVTIHVEAEGESVDMEVVMDQLIKYDYGKIYMEQRSTTISNGVEDTTVIYIYIEEDEYGYTTCYAKMDDSDYWYQASLSAVGFYSLEELTPFYDQYLDHTYFTKTGYGFELADENARKYFSDALDQAFSAAGLGGYISDDMNLDMYAQYYVCEGALSGMRIDASVDMSLEVMGQTATLAETVNTVLKCTNYGSTVIDRPNVD